MNRHGKANRKQIRGLKKKGYIWVTLGLFVITLTLHWIFGCEAYKEEQAAHNQVAVVSSFMNEMLRELDPDNYKKVIQQFDDKYPRK